MRFRLERGFLNRLRHSMAEDDEARTKHNAAKRWVSAVNNWGHLERWAFHACRTPRMIGRELKCLQGAET